MIENEKYLTIKKLVETCGNKKRAALHIGCSLRHVNRMIQGYHAQGKSFFLHKNRGRKPVHALSKETQQTVLDLYRSKYYDTNFTHCTELLAREDHITISTSTLRNILQENFILSPKATRVTKKRMKQTLKTLQSKTKSKKKREELQTNLVAIEDAHSRRPRCAYFGELLQMDASQHLWFGKQITHLHIAVDDATGIITGAYFDKQETLNGYYQVFHQILTKYGIPYLFFTDNRTIFEYKQKKAPSIEEDTYTQFAYACKQLGVALKTSSVPQAKGRVERLFQTLQSRLPVELRLAGITELDEANEFLNSYIKEFNIKFSLPLHPNKSVFEIQPEKEKIPLFLSVLTERVIDNGHCIRFKKKYYRTLNELGQQVHFYKGTKAMVIETFDKQLFCNINDTLYALEAVPEQKRISKEFDLKASKVPPKKRNIPAMNHPWRSSEFWKFVHIQMHHLDKILSA